MDTDVVLSRLAHSAADIACIEAIRQADETLRKALASADQERRDRVSAARADFASAVARALYAHDRTVECAEGTGDDDAF